VDRISEAAARSRIKRVDGQEQELRETWATQPVVLAFVRHFG
jgi:hypothetical protein